MGGGAPPVDPDVVTKLPRAPPPGMNPDTVEAPKAPQNQGHHGGIMARGFPQNFGCIKMFSMGKDDLPWVTWDLMGKPFSDEAIF